MIFKEYSASHWVKDAFENNRSTAAFLMTSFPPHQWSQTSVQNWSAFISYHLLVIMNKGTINVMENGKTWNLGSSGHRDMMWYFSRWRSRREHLFASSSSEKLSFGALSGCTGWWLNPRANIHQNVYQTSSRTISKKSKRERHFEKNYDCGRYIENTPRHAQLGFRKNLFSSVSTSVMDERC